MDVERKDRIVIKHLRRVGTCEIVHVCPISSYRLTVNLTFGRGEVSIEVGSH